MNKEKQIEELANALYNKQDEFDLSNPFEVANCIINLGYRKINENEVVISKGEYEELINQNKGLKEENHILRLENNDLEAQVELKSKETAKKILTFIGNMYEECDSRFKLKDYQWHKDLCKQYGVEIGE